MPDRTVVIPDGQGGTVPVRFKDNGDGTFSAYLQDSAFDINANLGTGLDTFDDALSAQIVALYPAQAVGTVSGSITTLAIGLVGALPSGLILAGGPSIFDARSMRLTIYNNGTGQNITALSVSFSEVVGGVSQTLTYTYPSTAWANIGNNSGATVVIPLPRGAMSTVTATVTFAAAVTTGTVNIQAWFSTRALDIIPNEWQWTSNVVGINDAVAHVIKGSPGSNTRLCVQEAVLANESNTTGTRATLTGPSGTTWGVGWLPPNGNLKFGPYSEKTAWRLGLQNGISLTCGTAGASVDAALTGFIEPI